MLARIPFGLTTGPIEGAEILVAGCRKETVASEMRSNVLKYRDTLMRYMHPVFLAQRDYACRFGNSIPQNVGIYSVAEHRAQLDTVQMWLDDKAELVEGAWTANSTVVSSYTAWCAENNYEPKRGYDFLVDSRVQRPASIGFFHLQP